MTSFGPYYEIQPPRWSIRAHLHVLKVAFLHHLLWCVLGSPWWTFSISTASGKWWNIFEDFGKNVISLRHLFGRQWGFSWRTLVWTDVNYYLPVIKNVEADKRLIIIEIHSLWYNISGKKLSTSLCVYVNWFPISRWSSIREFGRQTNSWISSFGETQNKGSRFKHQTVKMTYLTLPTYNC